MTAILAMNDNLSNTFISKFCQKQRQFPAAGGFFLLSTKTINDCGTLWETRTQLLAETGTEVFGEIL